SPACSSVVGAGGCSALAVESVAMFIRAATVETRTPATHPAQTPPRMPRPNAVRPGVVFAASAAAPRSVLGLEPRAAPHHVQHEEYRCEDDENDVRGHVNAPLGRHRIEPARFRHLPFAI